MTSWLLPLIGMSLAAWSFYDSGLFPKVKEEVCDTPACNHVSTIIRNSMNTSIDPCDDFYEFVCGNRESDRSSQSIYKKYGPTGPQFTSLADYLLRDELASEPSPDDILPVKQMKKLYKSCMNLEARRSEGIQRILNEFKKMGGWNSNLTWQEINHHYDDLLGLNAFYSFGIESFSGRRYIREIYHPPHVGVEPKWDLIKPAVANLTQLMNAKLSSDELDALGELGQKMVENWKSDDAFSREPYENITLFMKWWEKSIDGISKSHPLLANINWMDIFQELSQEPYRTLLKDTSILFRKGTLGESIVHAYASLPELSRTIVNRIQLNFLLEMMPYVNLEGLENIISTLEKHRIVTKSWLTDCLLMNEPASAYLYKKKYNCCNGKADTMFRNTQQALKARMDHHIRMDFKEEHTGSNDYIADLTEYYEGLTIGDSYIENMFSLKRTQIIRSLKHLGKRFLEKDFAVELVFYSPIASYHPSLPDYYGYGHLMFQIMLSQIDHGEEENGISSDAVDLNNGCDFPSDIRGYGLSRILDIWALEAAWNAYAKVKKEKFPYGEKKLPELTEFTDDQMFFISYAQGNCHEFSRVNDVLSSTVSFSEAFKCNNKSKMNPEIKCDAYAIWEKILRS